MRRLPVVRHRTANQVRAAYRACSGGVEKTRWHAIWLLLRTDTPRTPAQVADLTAWVKMGAPISADAAAVKSKLSGLTEKARQHWAFQPVKKPAVPVNKNQQWCRTPVDCFILQKLEAEIRDLLSSRESEASQKYSRFGEGLRDAIERFEAHHPDLAMVMGQLAEMLARIGI